MAVVDAVADVGLDCERALLGAALSGVRDLPDLFGVVEPTDFLQPAHESIWRAVVRVYESGGTPDPLTVRAALGEDARRCSGGPVYLQELMQACPVVGQALWYAEQVAACSVRRRIREAAVAIGQLADNDALDPAELGEAARQRVDEATSRGTSTGGAAMSDIVPEVLDLAEHGAPPGLPTPWPDLNAVIGGGLKPGTLTVVGARPGLGKSVLGANVAARTALRYKQTALFVSLEMSRHDIGQRMLAAHAGVPLQALTRARALSEADWERVREASPALMNAPIIIDDRAVQTVGTIRTAVRDAARHARIGVVIVDYLQLLTPRDRKIPREQQVAEMSRGLKLIAREQNVPVIALAQVNRTSTLRRDGRPTLADLRESGGIEADADTVILLHRDDEEVPELRFLIAKNRNGPVAEFVVIWQGHYARIVNYQPAGGDVDD